VPAGVPSELVARRPDLAAAEARLAAAGFEVAAARAALYPQVRLTGSAGRSSEELEDLLDNDFTVWSIAGNLLQPIFQGGRLRAGVDLARATFEEATALYAGQVLRAFREVETSLGADAFLAGQVAALEEAAGEAREAQELAEERYRSGLQDFLSVLEAQRRLYDAESRLLEVRRARIDARIDLILALGGGFSTAAPPPTSTGGPAT
jgi:NodT family efflux transporter outer membrane factor (OMF) lipoprotein